MSYVHIILKGFSQIFFQENIILGFLIALGLAIASPTGFLLAVIGNLTSYILASLANVSKDLLSAGLYGYNGVLAGLAMSILIKQLPIAILATIVASALSVLIFYLFFKHSIPPLAAPFVLSVWLIVLVSRFLKG